MSKLSMILDDIPSWSQYIEFSILRELVFLDEPQEVKNSITTRLYSRLPTC